MDYLEVCSKTRIGVCLKLETIPKGGIRTLFEYMIIIDGYDEWVGWISIVSSPVSRKEVSSTIEVASLCFCGIPSKLMIRRQFY